MVVWRSTATAWWFGAVATVDSLSLTLILSLKLDVGFSFALNFCCGYECQIYGGGGGGCCVVYGDGFTMGLHRLL